MNTILIIYIKYIKKNEIDKFYIKYICNNVINKKFIYKCMF